MNDPNVKQDRIIMTSSYMPGLMAGRMFEMEMNIVKEAG
jgi:hypothetical protein